MQTSVIDFRTFVTLKSPIEIDRCQDGSTTCNWKSGYSMICREVDRVCSKTGAGIVYQSIPTQHRTKELNYRITYQMQPPKWRQCL